MVRAYPVNNKGQQEGPVRTFLEAQWNRMVSHHGKKLRWKQVDGDHPDQVETKIPTMPEKNVKPTRRKASNKNEK